MGGRIETESWYSDSFAQALCISRNCFSCELWGPSSWVSCENAFSFLTEISTMICFYSDIMFYGIDLFCFVCHDILTLSRTITCTWLLELFQWMEFSTLSKKKLFACFLHKIAVPCTIVSCASFELTFYPFLPFLWTITTGKHFHKCCYFLVKYHVFYCIQQNICPILFWPLLPFLPVSESKMRWIFLLNCFSWTTTLTYLGEFRNV